MLVTFKTDSYTDVTLFKDVALTFLKVMGQRDTIPGSISEADVPAALSRLTEAMDSEQFLLQHTPSAAYVDSDEEEPSVSLKNRAMSLIELLSAAAASNSSIKWE